MTTKYHSSSDSCTTPSSVPRVVAFRSHRRSTHDNDAYDDQTAAVVKLDTGVLYMKAISRYDFPCVDAQRLLYEGAIATQKRLNYHLL